MWAAVLAHGGPANNALVRTTAVATRLQAGVADNVMPITGTLSFNIRSHPGEGTAVRRAVDVPQFLVHLTDGTV
jgi:hypothetical protein